MVKYRSRLSIRTAFGPGARGGGSARVLTEFEAVECLDLSAHQEVQRDIERPAETDQNR